MILIQMSHLKTYFDLAGDYFDLLEAAQKD